MEKHATAEEHSSRLEASASGAFPTRAPPFCSIRSQHQQTRRAEQGVRGARSARALPDISGAARERATASAVSFGCRRVQSDSQPHVASHVLRVVVATGTRACGRIARAVSAASTRSTEATGGPPHLRPITGLPSRRSVHAIRRCVAVVVQLRAGGARAARSTGRGPAISIQYQPTRREALESERCAHEEYQISIAYSSGLNNTSTVHMPRFAQAGLAVDRATIPRVEHIKYSYCKPVRTSHSTVQLV